MAGSVGQYTQSWFPWVATKSNTNFATRTQASTVLGMGRLDTDSTAQNNLFTADRYMDSVTWKLVLINGQDTDQGIFNVTGISGTQTVDAYAGAPASNAYSEVTGIAVTTPGVKTIQVSMATKNGSSSAYGGKLNSIGLVRTAGTASTPNGTDTPGYTVELVPWMGTKANTNWATRTQVSSVLGGGRLDTDTTAQNNLFTNDIWADAGTYQVVVIHDTDTDQGIHNITGVSGTQTVDAYAAAASNVVSTTTGIAVTAGVKTMQDSMATKNASASAYGGKLNSIKWIRTGA